MKFLITTFLIFIIIFFKSFISLADIQDDFSFNLDDNYKDVITLIDTTDPYKCNDKLKQFNSKISLIQTKLFDDSYGVSKIYDGVINSNILRLTSFSADRECEIEMVEHLDFCESTGKLVHYRVSIPISKDMFVSENPAFDKGWNEYIGPRENDKILESIFKGRLVSFSTFNSKTKLYRMSNLLIRNKFIVVNHSFFKKPKEAQSSSYVSLCPQGDNKIRKYKPKYNNINKVISTSLWFISRYELSRKYYNKCSVFFPKNRKVYDKYWNKYTEFNEKNFNKIKNKSEQILISLDNKNISKKFKDRVDGMIKSMTSLVDQLSNKDERAIKSSSYHCNEFFKRKPQNLKNSLEKQFSLNVVDVNFVIKMKLN